MNIRNFEYKTLADNRSSGIIVGEPSYKIEEGFWALYHGAGIGVEITCNITDISSNSLGARNNFGEYHVGYSDVIEKISNGYTHYQYISIADIPNSADGFTGKAYKKNHGLFYWPLDILQKVGLDINSDLSQFRGKLKKKSVYNTSNTPQFIEEYTYNTTSAQSTYKLAAASSPRGYACYRIYTTPCLLMSRKVTDQQGIVNVENYSYNSYNFITKQQIINSDGTSYSTNYEYLPVVGRLSPDVDIYMYFNNILNWPTVIKKMANTNIIDANRFEYRMSHGFPVLSKVKKLEMLAPIKEPIDSSLMTDIEIYHRYDKYGNPVYVTQADGKEIVYIWSYRGLYPIAKIELLNDNYAHVESVVKSVFAVTDINILADQDIPGITRLTEKGLRDSLPMCHVTTYTHKPLVGISSITDPAGRTTYYAYNENKKLKEIYIMNDGKKEVIESYRYNYSNR